MNGVPALTGVPLSPYPVAGSWVVVPINQGGCEQEVQVSSNFGLDAADAHGWLVQVLDRDAWYNNVHDDAIATPVMIALR